MGTRALISLIANDTEHATYSQYDGYPDGLGAHVLAFLHDKAATMEAVEKQVLALVPVEESGTPTEQQLEQLAGRYHEDVSSGHDWYSHLRKTQGDLDLILQSGFVTDFGSAAAREADASYIEYSYTIDFDSEEFIYRAGNLATPVLMRWKFDALPTEQEFLAATMGN